MQLFSQLGLLLWKNLLLQKNQVIISFFQVAVPILIATCVAYAAFPVGTRSCIDDMDLRTQFQLNISDSGYCLFGVPPGSIKLGYSPKTTLTARLMSRLYKCEYFLVCVLERERETETETERQTDRQTETVLGRCSLDSLKVTRQSS